ncbi:MAG: cytochrome b/b6 domain-containing protein [Thiogranum sp.]
MDVNRIQRTLVWSGWVRLAHGLIALSVIALMASGWLVKLAPGVAESASEYHDLAGIGLTLGLLLRIVLLFAAKGSAHWKALLPGRADLHGMAMTLRFYATMGKSPLPKWYAHNPLWAPLYLFILLILVLQTLTGLLMEAWPLIGGFYLPLVHDFWAPVILGFSCLHVVTVVLHDAKGGAADVSAMINGHRIFIVEDVDLPPVPGVQSVPLDRVGKPRNTSQDQMHSSE